MGCTVVTPEARLALLALTADTAAYQAYAPDRRTRHASLFRPAGDAGRWVASFPFPSSPSVSSPLTLTILSIGCIFFVETTLTASGALALKTRVQKWGNSLALRIPKAFAEQLGITDNAPVDISLTNGKLLVVPLADQPITLEDLLAGITDENIHHEVDTGTPVGAEAW